MAADLLSIAKSGAAAARTALDLTAQNIANASSEGYVRRTISVSELSANSVSSAPTAVNLAGVRVNGVVRNADVFRQAEVRRTGADAARASAEVQGLENIESSVEQTGVYDAIVAFEGSLQQLLSDPTDGSLRAAVLEQGRTLSETFNVASSSLDAVGKGLQFDAQDGVDEVNRLAGELARVNLRLSRASDQSSDQTTLLDQRDSLLEQMSKVANVNASYNPDKTVSVTIGGTAGQTLVSGGTTATLAMATAADGTISFTLDGAAASISSGALAGRSQALTQLADTRGQLDTLAAKIVDVVNTAQANGADLNGNAGQPLFSGTGAGDMAMIATNGSAIATAPAGSAANSRDPGNLTALRNDLATADPAGEMDTLLFTISSAVAGRTVTRDALESIASTAKVALQAQAGVDLDEEAVSLVRYQQAFQANGRVMQVASDIFDSILNIR
ncbi:flagellar hook-associated protein FlgK [Novosphingobium pentaromativorans]|uniref:Flagellar hook-associated protein 1 n=1 Tax=Novosphingobium pentaromativorans US6-1 TaxID=1088721 RepID=G6EAJ4_9SPHN|nr:flagellar hook-associated protein FlgK [Novosphingobium pentaromativorans]AIT80653.1 flagellar hook protein [Novosphingobium pentaromativorans US6-1]EHJ61631.1 flagellar hook-associated protein 1 FlgK [Novosphingobium pentaromativorans US6-1]